MNKFRTNKIELDGSEEETRNQLVLRDMYTEDVYYRQESAAGKERRLK